MNIAEKLLTMANNTPYVCQVVNAAKVKAAGKVFRVEDFHPGTLQLTTAPDGEVEVWGKNLFNKFSPQYSGTIYTKAIIEGGKIKVTMKDNQRYRSANYRIPNGEALVGKRVTISGQWRASGQNRGSIALIWTSATNIHSSVLRIGGISASGASGSYTVPAKPAGAGELCLFLYGNSDGTAVAGDTVFYDKVQLELGNGMTGFADYQAPQTVVPDTAGVITLPEMATPMTLFSEQVMQCSYFPSDQGDLYETYQQLKAAQIQLKEALYV